MRDSGEWTDPKR